MAKKSKYSFSDILFSTAFIHNPVLIQAVGLGAVVAVATTLKTSLLLALAFAPVMMVTQVIASAMLKKVPRWIRVTIYLLLGTAIVIPIIYFIDIYSPELRLGAGIYLALTALNSITALHCEKVAVKTDVLTAFYDAVASSIGYAVVILLIGFVREILGMSTVWGIPVHMPIKYPGILMPFGGFIMLAFLAAGLKAFINWKFPEQSAETEIKIKKTSVIVSKKKLKEEEAKINEQIPNEDVQEIIEEAQAEELVAEEKETDSETKENEKSDGDSSETAEHKTDTQYKPEYDINSLLKPLDSTEYDNDDIMSLFGELHFEKKGSAVDTKIDALLDDIMKPFEAEDEEEKK